MKKTTLLIFGILSMCFSAYSQVQIGNGTSTTGSAIFTPFAPSSQFSYSQTIYLSTEIKATGTITHIQWYYRGSSPLTNSQNLDIYMAMTDKAAFASKSDWVTPSSLTKVFSGGITTDSNEGWITIDIDDFNYNDSAKNLVIAVDENTPLADGSTDRFNNTAVPTARSLVYTSSSVNVDPINTVPFPQAFASTSFIPNVFLLGISAGCPVPFNLNVSGIGSTTATVAWDAPAVHPTGPSEYFYSLESTPPTAGTTPTGFIPKDQFSVTLTGLIPAKTYYFWSRHNCEGGGYSDWSAVTSFLTLCAPAASFSENFDSAATPKLPTCWTSIVKGGGVCPSARVYTTNLAFSPSAPNVLAMDNCNSDGTYDIIAVSPVISTLNQGAYRLRFRVYAALPGSTVEVGTLNSNDSNTFVFNKIGIAENLTSTFTEYTVPFTAYTGTDTYIGIRASDTNPQQNTIYIDNVVWEFIPTCPNVTNVKVVSATDSTAEIGWTESGTEELWDIVIGPAITDDPTTLDPNRIKRTDISGAYTYEGLTGSTAYKAWVRSVCGDGPNDGGAWIYAGSFTTTCTPLTEFSENFNNLAFPALPQCWAKIIRPNSGTIGNGSKVETDNGNNGAVKDGGFVKIYSYLSTGDYEFILVTPPVPNLYADTANKHRLRFWSRYAADVEIGTLSSNTETAVFTPYETVTMVNGITEYIVNFDTPPTVGAQKFIGFRFVNPPVVGGYGISFDDIVWEKIPECPEVTAVAVPETTTVSAKVTWTHNGEGGAWEVALGDMAATNPDILPKLVSEEDPFLVVGGGLNPLSPGTSYKVWVRSNCGVKGYSVWTGPVVFTTECLPVDAFSEGFDAVTIPQGGPLGDYQTNELPPCWSRILRGGQELSQFAHIRVSTASYTSTLPNFTAPNYVTINRQPGSTSRAEIILVSPAISTLGQPYRLMFDSHLDGMVEVGVVDGNTNDSNWYPFGEPIIVNFNGGRTVVDFTNYDGVIPENAHIGIRSAGSYPSYGGILRIDNIKWEPIPACNDVTDLAISLKSTNDATITWTAGGGETSWQVVKGSSSVSDPNTLTSKPANINSITFDELAAQTTYKVWVRSVCNAGVGSWVGPLVFTTPCTAANVPYVEDFQSLTNLNNSSSPKIPACDDEWHVYGGNSWQGSFTATKFFNGVITNVMRCFSTSATDHNEWFFTRGVHLEQGVNYVISYVKATSNSGTENINNIVGSAVDFKVAYGTSQTPLGMTTELAKHEDFVGWVTPADEVPFTVPATGDYYFGFHNYSPAGAAHLMIDDINIKVDPTLSRDNASGLSKFDYYPNPVRERLNVTYNENIDSVSIFNMLGQRVLYQSINATNGVIDMAALAKGTYLLKVSFDNHVKTVKVIKE